MVDEELEHGVTTLAEIHMKMLELDPTEDKSLDLGSGGLPLLCLSGTQYLLFSHLM